MDIICDQPEHLPDLIRLNEIWIKEHFSLEAVDRALAADPQSIARDGGHTICAVEDGRVVGAVALFRGDEGHFELARMAVEPTRRQRGIGRALALAAIRKATERGATRLTLLSNTMLAPAIGLYRSLGFQVVLEQQHPEYARCNIVMEKALGESALPPQAISPGQEEIRSEWCVVANVVDEHPFGPDGLESRRGTKQFRPGAKVYVISWFPGMCESVVVIGIPRKSRKFIRIAMRAERLRDLRLGRMYSPAALHCLDKFREASGDAGEITLAQAEHLLNALPHWGASLKAKDPPDQQ